MTKWILLVSFAALFVGIQSLRADEPGRCSAGHAVFGRVVCSSASGAEALLDAYFLGATSIREVESRYGERLRRFGDRCLRKLAGRGIATTPFWATLDRPAVNFRISTVESCIGRRGFQEPCARNADCLENFCHPDRGTCGAVFTVPLGAVY